MKDLEDWQIVRIRDALSAYRAFERNEEGMPCIWKDVRNAVAKRMNYEIAANPRLGAEVLRKFVDGNKDETRPGGRAYTIPKRETLSAIIQFLKHDAVGYLSDDELMEYTPGPQAGVRVSEFLKENCPEQFSFSPSDIESGYRACHREKDGWSVRHLILQTPSDDGVFEVIETRHYYNADTEKQALAWDEGDRNNKKLRTARYGGWAVITPEDTIMIWLKDEMDGVNHRYLGIGDVGLMAKAPPENRKLHAIYQDYGHDLSRDKTPASVMRKLADDVVVFQPFAPFN